jgi:hypothetical protein
MRSQVQVLAGPPPITPGHSAVGSEPRALAASLGRAWAARPPRPARPLARSGPPTRASGPRPPPTVVAHPAQDDSHAAGAATSRRSLLPCPRAAASHRVLSTPAWPAWPLSRSRAAAASHYPARIRHRLPLTNARLGSVARVRAPSAVDRAAWGRGSHRDLDPFLW